MDKEKAVPDGKVNENKASKEAKVHYLKFGSEKSVAKSKKEVKQAKIKDFVSQTKPEIPVYFLRPQILKKAAKWFIENFADFRNFDNKVHKSEILYSVKSNPEESALQYLYESGIRNFDVASLNEIKLIDGLFGKKVKMFFMHPVKPRESIFKAYFEYGIRDFSLDSSEELKKILDETKNAKDLALHLRLAIPNSHSAIDLSGKFGVRPTQSINLIRKIRASSKTFGICFHVGSQCMNPTQYRSSILIAKEVIKKAQVKLDVLDIGGGFPSIYPAMTPPDLNEYMDEIRSAIKEANLSQDCVIWCEPGRALVAESGSLLVRVEGRKKNMLYINDGTYGGLFDAGFPAFIYPCKAYRIKKGAKLEDSEKESFGFYGPTCDSMDVMKGPFYLPKNINEGDYIEIGQLGAYSKSIRTDFNGFNEFIQIEVEDAPIQSLYLDLEEEAEIKKLK